MTSSYTTGLIGEAESLAESDTWRGEEGKEDIAAVPGAIKGALGTVPDGVDRVIAFRLSKDVLPVSLEIIYTYFLCNLNIKTK